MATKTSPKTKSTRAQRQTRPTTDTDLESFLAEHHEAVEAKLQKARQSIARGRVKALEPLPTLLRDARRNAKTAR
jgi:hypothetical protein